MDDDWPTAPVDLTGSRLAYAATPCLGRRTLAVRDLETGSEWRLESPQGQSIEAIRAAGRFVAVVLPGHVTVVDALRHSVRYELELTTTPGPGQIDVAADGSLAVMTGPSFDRCDGRVTRYTSSGRAEPPIARACRLVAALGSGTVVERPRKATYSIVHAGPGASGLRTVVDLGRRVLEGADADGSRLVWALARCSRATAIHIESLGAHVSVPAQRC